MNKEILEITKRFHDTYEKLSSDYNYETRKDTKAFDVNSSNGKLMYATVSEVVNPILEENKQLNKRVAYLERSNDRREETILEQRQEIVGLETRWNILKECLKDVMNSSDSDDKDFVETILDIMQEIEQGSDE